MPVPIPNLQQLQINPPQPATMRLQAMGMQNELSRIGIAKDRNAIAREGMALDKEQFEFNKKQAIFAKSRDYISSLEREEFPKYKEWLNKLFSELASLLPDDVMMMPDDEWNELKKKIEVGTDNFSKMQIEQAKQVFQKIESINKEQKEKEAAALKHQRDIELKKTIPGKAPGDEGKNKPVTVAQIQAKIVDDVINKGKPVTELTPEEKKLFDKAVDKSASFIDALFAAGIGSSPSNSGAPVIKFNEMGELVTEEEPPQEGAEIGPEGQTIIRKKMPTQ